MGRLKDSSQVGGIALCERHASGQLRQRNAPRQQSFGARHLEQAVEPACDRRREREILCGRNHGHMTGSDVAPYARRQGDSCVTRFVGGERWEQGDLIAVERSSPVYRHGLKEAEAQIERAARGGVPIGCGGLKQCALEPHESAAELFVGAAVCTPTDGSKKGVQRETNGAVGRHAGFDKATAHLDVDILVKGARKSIPRIRDHAPSSPSFRREHDG